MATNNMESIEQQLIKLINEPYSEDANIGFESLKTVYPEPNKYRAFLWSNKKWYEVDFSRLIADTTAIWNNDVPNLEIVPADDIDASGNGKRLSAAKPLPEAEYQNFLAYCHYDSIDESLGNELTDNLDNAAINNYHQRWLAQIARYKRHIAILELLCQRFPESVCNSDDFSLVDPIDDGGADDVDVDDDDDDISDEDDKDD
jgi:hypothetical protein